MNNNKTDDYTSMPLTVESVYEIGGTVTSTLIDDEFRERRKTRTVARGKHTFDDGERIIDFILVWDSELPSCTQPSAVEKRKVFEKNLLEEGLELEGVEERSGGGGGGSLHFVKVHAPLELLRRYAEILKLRMPMRKIEPTARGVDEGRELWKSLNTASRTLLERFTSVDRTVFPDQTKRFTAIYTRDKEYLFDVKSENFFTQAVRSRIVQFILDRSFFGEPSPADMFVFGLERLLSEQVYTAAYPLHDGEVTSENTLRGSLAREWASLSKWYRYQPLDYLREYFGVKIGLYFTWLGFYTHLLLCPALVGLACFVYSWTSLSSHLPSREICEGTVEVKMCPLCDKFCDYWELRDTCFHSKVTYLFDNPTTVFFAVFMSVWAVTYLELWKRYSAEITHRWDLTGFDRREEQPRPQYLARVERFRSRSKPAVNVVTGVLERKLPYWTLRFPRTVFSFSIVLLLVALALAAVLGVVLYRMSVLAALSVYGGDDISSYIIIFTSTTAALINLASILLFNWIYCWLAEYLTELEMHRTQTEFDDSLTLKMYLLEFVNYYASIFYIAFCKGKLVGHPAKYNRLFGYRQEECGPGGCLLELSIQLSIIMIGKQAINTILEMFLPQVMGWWRSRGGTDKKSRTTTSHHQTGLPTAGESSNTPQWEKDYQLLDWGPQALFPEYLEMVLQFGFVTIFVSAFPLAPLFALVNNVLEMRLDGKKLLTFHRRPVAQRVRNIGVWYRILSSVSKLAVVTNGFIIAFTSDFIPRLVYRLTESPDHSLSGFLNASLSVVETSDLDLSSPPASAPPAYCAYFDFREPPWSPNKYEKTGLYWRVLTARLLFVVIFENLVLVSVLLVGWWIPDVPARLSEQIRREAFITNEIIIHQEANRARGGGGCGGGEEGQGEILDETRASLSKILKKTTKDSSWSRDLSVPPRDEPLVHRPSNYGEISEVTV